MTSVLEAKAAWVSSPSEGGESMMTASNMPVSASKCCLSHSRRLCVPFSKRSTSWKLRQPGSICRDSSLDCKIDSLRGWSLSRGCRSSGEQPRPLVALHWGSRSISSVRWLAIPSPQARLTAVVVLPTPPFWFATQKILGIDSKAVLGLGSNNSD